MAEDGAQTDRQCIRAEYELGEDGMDWTIRVATDAGEFLGSASRLQDVERRACQLVSAVLELPPGTFDLDLVHILNLDAQGTSSPGRVR
jgi:hypothetical protein